jgi:hypothetical protein
MTRFPSVEWFREAADLLQQSQSFKQFGSADTQMGVQVGDKYFQINFEAFEVAEIKEIDPSATEDLDFTLVQEPEEWKAMLENIKQNGQAEHEFTLNSLDLHSEKELAIGKDYTRRDMFYRVNQTLQDYFDQSAKMEYEFAF